MNRITEEELRRLHNVELEIMDEIHRICIKHNITYFLDSGSALGAIRHGGFIPWDDDMDIGMLRPDYERFCEIAPNELKKEFVFHSYKTDPNYYKLSAKVHKRGTFYPENNATHYNENGIFIDIFPFDGIEPKKKVAERTIKISRFLMRLYRSRFGYFEKQPFTIKIKSALLRLLPLSAYRCLLLNFWLRQKKCTGLTCFSYKMVMKQYIYFRYDTIIPVKTCRFENREYLIMNSPDEYLKVMYGDYMQLPPEEKRECHLKGKIKYGNI